MLDAGDPAALHDHDGGGDHFELLLAPGHPGVQPRQREDLVAEWHDPLKFAAHGLPGFEEIAPKLAGLLQTGHLDPLAVSDLSELTLGLDARFEIGSVSFPGCVVSGERQHIGTHPEDALRDLDVLLRHRQTSIRSGGSSV
jgi:hypothetical protein